MTALRWLCLIAVGLPSLAAAQGVPAIEHAWARATTASAQTGAAYLTITSPQADRLLGMDSPAARAVELHVSREQDGVMQMRPVPDLAIPAAVPVQLAPGGYHAMLMGLARPLRVGDHFPLTLHFAHAGAVTTEVTVERAGAVMRMEGGSE